MQNTVFIMKVFHWLLDLLNSDAWAACWSLCCVQTSQVVWYVYTNDVFQEPFPLLHHNCSSRSLNKALENWHKISIWWKVHAYEQSLLCLQKESFCYIMETICFTHNPSNSPKKPLKFTVKLQCKSTYTEALQIMQSLLRTCITTWLNRWNDHLTGALFPNSTHKKGTWVAEWRSGLFPTLYAYYPPLDISLMLISWILL